MDRRHFLAALLIGATMVVSAGAEEKDEKAATKLVVLNVSGMT